MWIQGVSEKEAEGYIKSYYNGIRKALGIVPNLIIAQSLDPKALRHRSGLYDALLRADTGVSRTQREMIAVVVSVANNCHY